MLMITMMIFSGSTWIVLGQVLPGDAEFPFGKRLYTQGVCLDLGLCLDRGLCLDVCT